MILLRDVITIFLHFFFIYKTFLLYSFLKVSNCFDKKIFFNINTDSFFLLFKAFISFSEISLFISPWPLKGMSFIFTWPLKEISLVYFMWTLKGISFYFIFTWPLKRISASFTSDFGGDYIIQEKRCKYLWHYFYFYILEIIFIM